MFNTYANVLLCMTAKRTLKVLHAKDYNEMSSDELRETLKHLRADKMSIDGKNKSPMATPLPHPSGQARQNRKSIARVMTILVKRKERCVE
jgi:ribosomal protein L29